MVFEIPAAEPSSRQLSGECAKAAENAVEWVKSMSGIELDFNNNFSGTWINKNPIDAPSQRFDFAMAYDFTDGIVLLFGGSTQNIFYLNV